MAKAKKDEFDFSVYRIVRPFEMKDKTYKAGDEASLPALGQRHVRMAEALGYVVKDKE